MSAAGLFLWMVSVLLLLAFLTGEERKRVEQCEGLLLLLRHIRSRVAAYGLPREEIYQSFQDRALEACGFLEVLRGDGLRYALESGKLSLGDEALRPVLAFAAGEDTRLREEELAAASLAIEAMELCVGRRRSALPERLRLCRTLVLTGGMMIAVLLL